MQNQVNLKCIIPKCGKEYLISSTKIKCECGNLLDVNYKHSPASNLKEIFMNEGIRREVYLMKLEFGDFVNF